MEPFRIGFRRHLGQADLDFVIGCLSSGEGEEAALLRLLTDPSTVDGILDQPALLQRVLEDVDTLRLSARLYFYLLTRHSLKRAGLDDPEMADYISGVLEQNTRHTRGAGSSGGLFYVVDWMERLEASTQEERFRLYVGAGNRLLFLCGVFPGHLAQRSQRCGAPGLSFYESVGRQSFDAAARHPISRAAETDNLFHCLAETFPHLRCALNDVSSRLVVMD